MASSIVKVTRCIFPQGKAVLSGYDASGAFVFGLGVKAKSVARWAMQGVSKADKARVIREHEKFLQEQETP